MPPKSVDWAEEAGSMAELLSGRGAGASASGGGGGSTRQVGGEASPDEATSQLRRQLRSFWNCHGAGFSEWWLALPEADRVRLRAVSEGMAGAAGGLQSMPCHHSGAGGTGLVCICENPGMGPAAPRPCLDVWLRHGRLASARLVTSAMLAGLASRACSRVPNPPTGAPPRRPPRPQEPFLRSTAPFLPAKRGDTRVRVPGTTVEEDCSGSSLFAPELNVADLTAEGGRGLLTLYEQAGGAGCPVCPLSSVLCPLCHGQMHLRPEPARPRSRVITAEGSTRGSGHSCRCVPCSSHVLTDRQTHLGRPDAAALRLRSKPLWIPPLPPPPPSAPHRSVCSRRGTRMRLRRRAGGSCWWTSWTQGMVSTWSGCCRRAGSPGGTSWHPGRHPGGRAALPRARTGVYVTCLTAFGVLGPSLSPMRPPPMRVDLAHTWWCTEEAAKPQPPGAPLVLLQGGVVKPMPGSPPPGSFVMELGQGLQVTCCLSPPVPRRMHFCQKGWPRMLCGHRTGRARLLARGRVPLQQGRLLRLRSVSSWPLVAPPTTAQVFTTAADPAAQRRVAALRAKAGPAAMDAQVGAALQGISSHLVGTTSLPSCRPASSPLRGPHQGDLVLPGLASRRKGRAGTRRCSRPATQPRPPPPPPPPPGLASLPRWTGLLSDAAAPGVAPLGAAGLGRCLPV